MTERSQSPTVRRRRLAAELRTLREDAGLTMEEVAQALDLSRSTISRIEAGKTARPRPRDIRDMLVLYGVDDERREALIELARDARERGWWDQYKSVFPGAYVGLEAEASNIRMFQPLVIPGLLQTAEYATELTRASLIRDPDEISTHVEARMLRQRLLTRTDPPPPRFWAIIDEAALLRPVGDVHIRREQLRRLVETSPVDHVTIQVLPLSAGPHVGLSGQFVILDYPHETDRSVVYVETPTDGLYLEERDQLERYTLMFQHLCATALGADASIDYLSAMIDKL